MTALAHNGTPTSKAAAESMRHLSVTVRNRVYEHLLEQADYGATAAEIEDTMCIAGNTLRPRLVELRQAGRIEDSGRTRPTPSGRQAVVWVAVWEQTILNLIDRKDQP